MVNPYETSSGIGSPPSGNVNSPSNSLARKLCLAAIHLAFFSILLVAMMCAGGMVTYAPNVTQYEMQNIYLSLMFWYGGGVATLQVVGVFLVFRFMRTEESNS